MQNGPKSQLIKMRKNRDKRLQGGIGKEEAEEEKQGEQNTFESRPMQTRSKPFTAIR